MKGYSIIDSGISTKSTYDKLLEYIEKYNSFDCNLLTDQKWIDIKVLERTIHRLTNILQVNPLHLPHLKDHDLRLYKEELVESHRINGRIHYSRRFVERSEHEYPKLPI